MREARSPFACVHGTSKSSVTKGVIDDAAHDAATSPYNASRAPTRLQAHAGNYKKGHLDIAGLRITIENPAGSHRRPEWPALASHYGYIRNTTGADGDHVDVFVRPGIDPEYQGPVFVVDQLTQAGDFDEHKVMLGWPTAEAAEAAYLENFTPGWVAGPLTEFTLDGFKAWLKGDTTGPIVKGDVSGHEFHGNQWTGGSGPKPTTTTGKTAREQVLNLLKSGHGFTVAELVKITGAKENTVKTALVIINNEKTAAKFNVAHAEIVKEKGGIYHLKVSDGQKPAGEGKPTKTDSLKTISKKEADAKYKETMGHATAVLVQNVDHYGDDFLKMHSCLLDFKNAKAEAMAQWTKDTTGVKQVAAPQQIFNADKSLWGNLLAGVPKDEALKTWKADTQHEKELAQASLAVDQMLGGSKAVALSDGTKYTGTGKGLEGIPKDVVPQGFETVSHDDFKGNAYASMNSANEEALLVGSGSSEDNKAEVCMRLQAELADSANYQKMKEALGFDGIVGQNSLESRLVKSWASSSGDSNVVSVAMQVAVRDTFGMKDEDLALTALTSLDKVGNAGGIYNAAASRLYLGGLGSPPPSDVMREGLKEFIAGMYRSTQADLAARGITEFAVVRGMTIGDDKSVGALVNTSMQPASSFTTRMAIADQFTQGGDNGSGTLYFARVPASQVLSTFRSGWGCTGEREVVVLSHSGMRMGQLGSERRTTFNVGKTAAQLYKDIGMKGSGNVSLAGEGG